MRKLLLIVALCVFVGGNIGCIIPAYSGDPLRRTEQLIYTSENLRLMPDEWERMWLLDQPDHGTPFRNHGGII